MPCNSHSRSSRPRKIDACCFIKPIYFPLCSTPAAEETPKEVEATKEETNGHAKNGEEPKEKNGDHKNGDSKNGDSNGAEKKEEEKKDEEKEVGSCS